MSNKAIHFFTLCLLLSLSHSRVMAQEATRVVPMKEIMGVYAMLDSLFPFSDYVLCRQSEVAYWVNRKLPPEYDMMEGIKKIQPCIDILDALPATGQQMVKKNSADGGLIYACFPSFRDDEQENFVEIVFKKGHIHFAYNSRKKHIIDCHQANDLIANEMEGLFKPYISKPDAVCSPVVYDGPTYQYQMVTFNNTQKVKQHAKGTLYDIPGCKEADWQRIFSKIKSYANTDHVEVAWNEVYRHYECAQILIDRASTVPIVYAAAWKEGVLKLLRLEGTADYNIVLPRIWPEDSPIFDPSKNTDIPKP